VFQEKWIFFVSEKYRVKPIVLMKPVGLEMGSNL
jgi:hypothetical protein